MFYYRSLNVAKESIYVVEEEHTIQCTVDMTVDMTALILSWGELNVCGPGNQQSRLTNGCGAGTNEPGWMPPCPPHSTR